MIPKIILKQLPAYFLWCNRRLEKLKPEEEEMHAKTASKSETTGLAGLPTLREQTKVVPPKAGQPLVSSMWRDVYGELENQEDKGGDTEEVSNETKSHGELVVKLVRLKASLESLRQDEDAKLFNIYSPRRLGVIAGKLLAYNEAIGRLNYLIITESETKPKEG